MDLSTGVYIREDDDLFLDTAMPAVLRRTYNSLDAFPRQFGMNAMHAGEWWLHGDGDPRIPWVELILADGGRIHFTRISSGYSRSEAVFRHVGTPTEFAGATMTWNGSAWEMRLTDGSLDVFHDCQRRNEHCSLLERRDAQGHRVEYIRDESQTLQRIESEGQRIALEYDSQKRIVRASDTAGHVVSYSYDERGRLVRAASSDGTIRGYGYDYRNKLIVIREPGRIVRNWYDETGLVSRQEVRKSDADDHPYIAVARYQVAGGAVVQSDFDEGDGVERRRYNSSHYIVSDTFDADGPVPATFTYDRDERTNAIRSATLSCSAQPGAAAIAVSPGVEHDDEARLAAILEHCLPRRHQRSSALQAD